MQRSAGTLISLLDICARWAYVLTRERERDDLSDRCSSRKDGWNEVEQVLSAWTSETIYDP